MSRTDEEKSTHYSAMSDSVEVINDIIDGSKIPNATTEEKKERVARNYTHLEGMVALDDWGDEDMTASNKAIIDGKAYVG
jgi:hypothetical protein